MVVFKKILRCAFGVALAIGLACCGTMLTAMPAHAEPDTVNYNSANLENQDFSHRGLQGKAFVSTAMRGISFEGSNLTNAMMTKGVLLNANLRGANLSGALLDRVFLVGADLTNAILQDATLSRTSFEKVTITGADFTGAILDRYEISQLCQRAQGVNPVTQVETRESLGCR